MSHVVISALTLRALEVYLIQIISHETDLQQSIMILSAVIAAIEVLKTYTEYETVLVRGSTFCYQLPLHG